MGSQTRNSGFENKERLDPPRRSGRKRQSVSYLIREEDDGSNDRYEKEDNGLEISNGDTVLNISAADVDDVDAVDAVDTTDTTDTIDTTDTTDTAVKNDNNDMVNRQ